MSSGAVTTSKMSEFAGYDRGHFRAGVVALVLSGERAHALEHAP
jgi:hypothetical protein